MVCKNIKMASIIKEILSETKGMARENSFIKINWFTWVNGRKANFMEKELYFIT